MRRAAIYARFSTDLQNDKSVDDQITLCSEYAVRIGCTVIACYSDKARSGASMFRRPGLADLMESAQEGGFDVLISEAPDRISRDMEDLAGIHKRVSFRGIEINCVNGGKQDSLQIGMHGIVGQMQREEGARKVKRGLMGVIDDGRNAGGKAYGYSPVLGKPGELNIVPAEAETVVRIFKAYAAGQSPRDIAGMLNKDGVPAPRGLRWAAATINGNGKRGNGILRNPLYAGRIIWNRVRMVKDPATGRRVSRQNDASEFRLADAPHLRIVDQALFDMVQTRKETVGGEHASHAPRNKRVLSGLLKCGACGGGLVMIGHDRSGPRIQCSTYRESRSCTNSGRYYIGKVETHVIDALRLQFVDPLIIAEYVKAYRDERRRIESEARRNRSTTERSLQDVQSKLDRLIGKIAADLISDDEAKPLLASLRAEKERHAADLTSAGEDTNVIELHPQAVERFRENIENLAAILSQGDVAPDVELIGSFRELVAEVIVMPRHKGEEYTVQIKGYLSSLLGADLSAVTMVAKEGFEPPTQGL